MPSAYFSGNVTKYNTGGSGDNNIGDGYIKAVEKVWLDSYTISFTLTKTTLDLAVLQPNKKLVEVIVQIETSASQTNGTLSLGFSEDGSFGTLFPPTSISHNATVTTITFPGGIFGQNSLITAAAWSKTAQLNKNLTGTQTTVTLQFNNWTMTTGTVKSIVRYT